MEGDITLNLPMNLTLKNLKDLTLSRVSQKIFHVIIGMCRGTLQNLEVFDVDKVTQEHIPNLLTLKLFDIYRREAVKLIKSGKGSLTKIECSRRYGSCGIWSSHADLEGLILPNLKTVHCFEVHNSVILALMEIGKDSITELKVNNLVVHQEKFVKLKNYLIFCHNRFTMKDILDIIAGNFNG